MNSMKSCVYWNIDVLCWAKLLQVSHVTDYSARFFGLDTIRAAILQEQKSRVAVLVRSPG